MVHPDLKKPYTLYTDTSEYAWLPVFTQAHSIVINGKSISHQHPTNLCKWSFQGSQLNWTILAKEAYAIYMAAKKLYFYIADADIIFQSDHSHSKKFLHKVTLNANVNNWGIEFND